MASPTSLKPGGHLGLRIADARVARIKGLMGRLPRGHGLFCALVTLLKGALMIQMAVQHVERLQIVVRFARPDYYYEAGEKPHPKAFDELARVHRTKFREWFRVDSPRCVPSS